MSENQNNDQSAPTGPVKKSPRDWAVELGHGPKKSKNTWTSSGMSRPMGSMAYEAAAVEHGWREHEHHTGEPLLMTREDFEAALAAVMVEKGNPAPHKAALSKHKGNAVQVRLEKGKKVEFDLNQKTSAERPAK